MNRNEIYARIHAHVNGEVYKIGDRHYTSDELCVLADLLIKSNLLHRSVSTAIGKAKRYIIGGIESPAIYRGTIENALKAAEEKGFKLPKGDISSFFSKSSCRQQHR